MGQAKGRKGQVALKVTPGSHYEPVPVLGIAGAGAEGGGHSVFSTLESAACLGTCRLHIQNLAVHGWCLYSYGSEGTRNQVLDGKP